MRRARFLLPMLLIACGDGPLGPGQPGRYEPVARCDGGDPFFDDGVIAVSSSHDGLFLLQLAP